MIRAAITAVIFAIASTAAAAQNSARIEPLFQALGLPAMLEIMRLEGLEYTDEMSRELMGRDSTDAWRAVTSEIYDVARLQDGIRASLELDLADADLTPMLAFFQSDLGQRIIELELSAREAMLSPDIEEVARLSWAEEDAAETAKSLLLRAFTEANALVDNNVVGAMNSNYAFYIGLADGGAFDQSLTEDEILSDVWSQEATIRQETEDWMFAYLSLAYRPLSEAELQAYLDFSRTPEGQVLNRAIFDAFDGMYVAISRALGAAAAEAMMGQDL